MAKRVNPMAMKSKAVCTVYYWMRAWGIPARMPATLHEGDLVVDNHAVVLSDDSSAASGGFVLDPGAILGSDVRVTVAELHRLTDFLGRGKPAGFRAATGAQRARSDDYLATSMRLTAFARTPNVPEADLQAARATLKREAQRAARRFRGILAKASLDWQDLYSIGMVFVTNYLSRYADLTDKNTNGKHLTLHLQQEFGHWAEVTVKYLSKRAPSTSGIPVELLVGTPAPGAVQVRCQLSESDDGERSFDVSYVPDQEDEADVPEEEPHFDTVEEQERWFRSRTRKQDLYRAKRQRAVRTALADGLAGMPHDKMVAALRAVVVDEHFQHPDARELADQLLYNHMKACPTCPKPEARRGDDEYAEQLPLLIQQGACIEPKMKKSSALWNQPAQDEAA